MRARFNFVVMSLKSLFVFCQLLGINASFSVMFVSSVEIDCLMSVFLLTSSVPLNSFFKVLISS